MSKPLLPILILLKNKAILHQLARAQKSPYFPMLKQ
jgi:hypothetical protein